MSTKSDLLDLLKKNIGTPVSGQQAADQLGVSRNAVWKAVSHLKEEGYPIESRTKAGYCLTALPDLLTQEAVEKDVHADIDVIVKDTVTSTNDLVKAGNWGDRPVVMIANRQTGGRGRLGRKFESPGGVGIYISFGMKPDFSIAHSPFVTMAAAVAVCRAVEKVVGIDTKIKWVNDIYYN
ncbi:MAG: biotin operon repressor, partial [Eubacterium sp.]